MSLCMYHCTTEPICQPSTQDNTLHRGWCIPRRQSTQSNHFLTHFTKMACNSESSVAALPELELSELELALELPSPLDEAPDELLDESAAGALAAWLVVVGDGGGCGTGDANISNIVFWVEIALAQNFGWGFSGKKSGPLSLFCRRPPPPIQIYSSAPPPPLHTPLIHTTPSPEPRGTCWSSCCKVLPLLRGFAKHRCQTNSIQPCWRRHCNGQR